MSINDKKTQGLTAAEIKEFRRQVAEHYIGLHNMYVEMLKADAVSLPLWKEKVEQYIEILVILANDEFQQIRPYIAAFISSGKGWTKLTEKIETICLNPESETYAADYTGLQEYLTKMKSDFETNKEMLNLDASLEIFEQQNKEKEMETNKNQTVEKDALEKSKEGYAKKLEELDTNTEAAANATVTVDEKPASPSELTLTEKIVVGAALAVVGVGVVFVGVKLFSSVFGDSDSRDVVIYDEN